MRSIRVTLSRWYIGLLTAILLLFSAALYFAVWSSLHRSVDALLLSRADGIANSDRKSTRLNSSH